MYVHACKMLYFWVQGFDVDDEICHRHKLSPPLTIAIDSPYFCPVLDR